jgi:hypothetical protein
MRAARRGGRIAGPLRRARPRSKSGQHGGGGAGGGGCGRHRASSAPPIMRFPSCQRAPASHGKDDRGAFRSSGRARRAPKHPPAVAGSAHRHSLGRRVRRSRCPEWRAVLPLLCLCARCARARPTIAMDEGRPAAAAAHASAGRRAPRARLFVCQRPQPVCLTARRRTLGRREGWHRVHQPAPWPSVCNRGASAGELWAQTCGRWLPVGAFAAPCRASRADTWTPGQV